MTKNFHYKDSHSAIAFFHWEVHSPGFDCISLIRSYSARHVLALWQHSMSEDRTCLSAVVFSMGSRTNTLLFWTHTVHLTEKGWDLGFTLNCSKKLTGRAYGLLCTVWALWLRKHAAELWISGRYLRCHSCLSHIPAFRPQSDWQQSCLAVHTHWANFTYPNHEVWHKDLWVDSYTVISALFPWQIQHHFSFSYMYIIPKILLIIFIESAFLTEAVSF